MSTRRRAGTWQDEVARSFSRLFSRSSSQEKEEESGKDLGEEQDRGDRSLSRLFFRSSSQEKKDGSDRTDHGEEQERSHSPSRLFFRKITQESKGGNDNVSPAKGTKEEQDRSRGFSRLFTRTSSQEKEEESDSSRGAREDHSRHEDNHSSQTIYRHEELSPTEPEQVTLEQTSSPPLHNISEPEEEKDGEFTSNSKVIDSEKQSRENFFHFIGNLFHFSPKSSQGNMKQSAGVQEPCKEHEDVQVKNNLDKEDLNQERTLDDQSRTEEASEQNPAQHEQENSRVSEGEDPKDVLKCCEDAATDTPKLNGHAQDAPAITYGTYRGSRRIRKLLKRRADVNSPIPEKEETPENCSVGDGTTENCLLLHDWVKMEPVPDRNCQDEIPPSKIYIKMQSNVEPCDPNSILHNDDNIIQKAKNSKLTNNLEAESKDRPAYSNIVQVIDENSSEIVERQQPNIEENVLNVPQLNAKESEILQPNAGGNLEDLQPTPGGSLNISGHLKQNVENSKDHSKESTISKKLEANNDEQYTDPEPKTVDVSDTVRHLQPSIDEVSELPNSEESVRFPEIQQTSIVNNSESETDPSLEVAENVNILPNVKDNVEDWPTQHVHAKTNISKSKKCVTLSVMDNLQPEVKDTLMRKEELEESSKENTEDPVDLGNCVSVNMQSSLQQSNLKSVMDSGDRSYNQQMVEVNLHVEDKPHKDPFDNLYPSTDNRLDKSSEKNGKNVSLPSYDFLKQEIERETNIIDLQPNAQLETSSTVAIEPNTMGNLAIEEQLQLHGDQNQPNWELNKTQSESEDFPNFHLQLNVTSEDLKQIENIEQLQTNANIISENDQQNDEELLKTEVPQNTKGSFQLKELNTTFLEKNLSEREDLPNLDLQLNETSITSKDLKLIGNIEHLQTNTNITENDPQNDGELLKTELQPNTKVSFQLEELNNTFLENTRSEKEDIPNLDLQLNETSRTSEQIENIEQKHSNITLKKNLQNDALLKTDPQPNSKVSFQLKELNDTLLQNTLSESAHIPNLDLQLNQASRASNDLQNYKELLKTELQPNTKGSFQLKELNNTLLEKPLLESEDIPHLDLQLSETCRTSTDLKEIGSIKLPQTNADIIPEKYPQKDREFLNTEVPPNAKVQNTLLEKTLSELDVSNLNLQLSEASRTSKDLKEIGNIEHLQTNANIIPENNPQNDGQFLKTEVPPSAKVALKLKELNNTVLENTLSESEDAPNLDLQINETSKTFRDLKEIGNIENLQTNANISPENDPQKDGEFVKIEVPPSAKVSLKLKELNNTLLEKTLSESKDFSNLDLQMNETSKTFRDLKEIGNIEDLQTNANISTENDPQKDGELEVSFQLKENSDESLLTSGIISKMIENQKPNIHIVSNVSDGIQEEGEEPDKPDEAVKERHIQFDISYDNPDNMTVPESCLNDISFLSKGHEAGTSRNISFDNGIECRSPSPQTISDSSSYADCIDVQFDSPNDSGIVSSQAYTPDEHILFKTLPSEILIKNASNPFAVDQKSQEVSVPKPDSSVNIQSLPILQNEEPMKNIHNVSEVEHESLVDGCNSASDLSIKISSPDKVINSNSDVYVAKVSVNTVNIEEVKISPYSLCSDIVSAAKLESPTFTKEVICIPNLSPTPTDTENTFQIFHVKDDKNDEDFATNRELPNNRGENLTDELPSSKKENHVTWKIINDSPNNGNSDSIPQYRCIEKKSTKITDKSPDVLIENFKNNNINVCTSDNVINVSLQARESERERENEALMANDSLKELDKSFSKLNTDSKIIHSEKLSDLLLHSALLHDVTDTNKIISSCSTTAKLILPDKAHSESSNELFEQKANEIIFSVLHSAIDELQNINQSRMKMPVNNHTLTDIKHVKENLSENHIDLEEHPDDHIIIEDTDLIMSMAVGIVNDVISSSKQLVVSNIFPDVLGKDITTNEATQQKTPIDFNDLSMDNHIDPVEDATNSNHVVSPLSYDNVSHLLTYEINSNVLHSENGVDRIVESNVLTKTEDEEHLRTSLRLDDLGCDRQMVSLSLGSEGSMEDLIYNNKCEESSNSSDFSDFLQFSVCNSHYIEISGSDDESTDEDRDSGNEQASGNDSFLSVQSRRVRIYPFALSPIYEDDSACEDTLSDSGSPRYNEGATASKSGNDHTSILSLLQSVSDRLKEADLEETSHEERFSSVSNDRLNKEGSGELEDIMSPSKTSLDAPSTLEDEKASSGKRSGLFITKSENKPSPFVGRQSFLLNLSSNIYGTKSSVESSSVPSFKSETSVSPTANSNLNQSMDLSPSIDSVNLLSPEPALPIQSSVLDYNPRVSPKSVYYQYFHAAQNYASKTEENESPVQKKLEEPKKTAEPEMDSADSDSLKFNPRPGKVILSDIIDQENKIELKANVLDATSWVFPNGVNIRVIRGCWILYEKRHFEGQAHVLEEGEAVLRHLWDRPGANTKLDKITIGSVKRVVKDYLPEVVISSLQDVSDSPIYIRTEVPSLENLVDKHPRSLEVNSGVWLVYTEPQYNGTVTVLEEGCELPQTVQDSGLKSMRPLKMGGLKVQLPSDPKIIVYEKPHFQGWSREITEDVSSIGTLTCDEDNSSSQDIGSIRVIGGIWVGYNNERYKGHQYLLEEGDYEDWHAWGGYNNTLQSIRYLQADFLESSVTLYETDEEDGKQINLFNQAIPDLQLAGYSRRTQCIDVKKGMWVAYRQKHFCGEQYVLEKGRYKTYMDWGGSNNTIMSIRPILLEPLGRNDAKHLIKAYTSAEFQGETMDFTQGISDFTYFLPMSFKVLRGCWLLCYKADTCDNLCVLEEGHFPDLASCGCPTAEIKYIKPIDYVFAEPSISLFALDSCEGRELHFDDAVTSVLSADLHFYAQSVWVKRGLWIAFEGANFLGRQMLLDPQQILNWSQFSGWKAIGSLRPLKQPSVYFMIKNRVIDKYLTASGKQADSRATFVSVSPRNGQTTQIWYFCRGFLKSKANDLCLDVIGGKNIPGSKVSLWTEHGKIRQKWKINKDGTISSNLSDDLILDLRGGNYYDQNYIVVNRVQENGLTQKWDIEIL